ncbi:MAG: DUF1015 domain-containing protein [Acidobacteriota bacterium]|nr:DUF1015 domain-containing protein [Acidobacteriota bacterium]
MAEISPFRGYRYSANKVTNLSDVVTQPYDKISEQMRQDYLNRHRYNIIRVIKNSNYKDAGETLTHWIQSHILKQDDALSFYPYEQIFQFEGHTFSRLGFVGLISLEIDADSVKEHERVLDTPLADRLNLIRATEANEGSIFMLYSEPSRKVDQLIRQFSQDHAAIIEVTDKDGNTHRMWQLCEPPLIAQIVELLSGSQLYIADGHHRFKTSQLYYKECQARGWSVASKESFDKRMVTLFNLNGPELKILPTHRGIHNLDKFDLNQLLSKAETNFRVKEIKDLAEWENAMQAPGVNIGLVAKGTASYYLLHFRDSSIHSTNVMAGMSDAMRQLDVNILHEVILHSYLGIDPRQPSGQAQVDYFRHREELLTQLEQGKYQLAFILNPTSLDQVCELSEQGDKMPQKSTDFYPKLLTGLVMMKMEIDKGDGG